MKKSLSSLCFIFTITVMTFVSFILPKNITTQLIFLGTLSFLFGLYVSVNASKKKCKKVGKLRSLLHGIFTAFISVGIFTLITYITILNKPVGLFITNASVAKFIAGFIYIFFALQWIIKRNYAASIEKVCTICSTDLVDNLKKYNKYLNKKPEPTTTSIEVRD